MPINSSIEPISEGEAVEPEEGGYEGGFESAEYQSEPGHSELLTLTFLLDDSGSMRKKENGEKKIVTLNGALDTFAQELKKDVVAANSIHLNVATFSGDTVEVEEFNTLAAEFSPKDFSAGGRTPMLDAIPEGADLSEQVKEEFKSEGKAYAQPHMVLLSDGKDNNSSISRDRAAGIIAEGERNDHLNFFAAGTPDADFDLLRKISGQNDPVKIRNFDFDRLFERLSNSLKQLTSGGAQSQTSQDLLPT